METQTFTQSSHSKKQKLIGFIKQRKYLLIALLLIVAVGGGLWYTAANLETGDKDNSKFVAGKKEAPKFYSPLTGAEVPDEATTKRTVTGIMIENSPDARPQSGLKDAGVVFEAIAEGGITRFLTLHQEDRPGLIGPVRSVRPYYVEWAAAFDPSVAHVGGSARALTMIRSGDYGHDIDQFFNGGSYYRATDRYAPHNVYTSFDRLDALNQSKGYNLSSFTGFTRTKILSKAEQTKANANPPAQNATRVSMDISSGLYNPSYAYDPATKLYNRSQNGAPHTDREGGQITAKVVIAMKVAMSLGFEDGYREQITTVGSGVADIFQDGTVVEGTWTKSSPKDQIKFTDASGKEIPLERGSTWITALPNDRSVSWQ